MVKFFRNTSILTTILAGFLYASLISAQTINNETLEGNITAERRLDQESVTYLGHQDDDEGRRPRGFLAALFGYPDEFENVGSAASQQKSVAVEAPSMYRGSANARGLGAKRMPSMVKAVIISAPKSTTIKAAMDKKITTEEPSSNSTEKIGSEDVTPMSKVTTNNIEDATFANGTDNETNATSDTEVDKSSNVTNTTEGTSGNKREASPSGSPRGPRGPLPFNGPGHPLPAGYILWHPVPAPFFGGAGVPEHALSSETNPVVLPSHNAQRGPPPGGPLPFLPHRPLFVEPFPGPFQNPGPFPITQFSSPPVFAISPDEAKSSRNKDRGRKKPAKGGKSKQRPKGRPNDEESEIQDGGDESFPERGLPRPVHVMLPPIPPHGFPGGPNFFGSTNQQQSFNNEGGPFRGPFGNQQNAEQNVRQPSFDQQRAPQNINNDFRGSSNDNVPNNNINGFRGPTNNFQGNDFRSPNNNFNGPNSNFNRQNSNFNGPSGNFNGPSGNFNGPNGNFNGPNSNFNGPSGNFNGPSGNFNGPSSNFNGPSSNFNGPNNNFNGPNNNFNGPTGSFDGPNEGPRSQKFRRPSPSPSAHPAKFEIDHQKKMQAEFEEAQEDKQRQQDVPSPPFPPQIVPPPIPPPANFPLPNFLNDQFRFASTLAPFTFSSPPPQFLDVPQRGSPSFAERPNFLPQPLPSPPPHLPHSAFTTASPHPNPAFHASGNSVPALSLPLAGSSRFPDGPFSDQFPSSTPQSLTDGFESTSNEDGLIYTRDFKKLGDTTKTTSESPFPVFSPALKQSPAPGGQTQYFGQQQRVQRFPAVQQESSSFPRIPANHNQGDGSLQNFRDDFRDSQSNNFRDSSKNSFRNNNPSSSNRNRVNRPNRLPDTHPNLPDVKSELDQTERHTQATTLQPEILSVQESSTVGSFSVPRDNYASPGFHTGHKGYPSSVTVPSFEGTGLSTTVAPRLRPTSKSQNRSPSPSQTNKDNGQSLYGSTFRTSFTSSPAGGSKSGVGSVDYHYEIQYQSPVPAVATYTTAKPLRSRGSTAKSSQKSDSLTSQASEPFGVANAPEYASSVYQPAEAQGGSYKPGTSRILLEMGKWSNGKEGQDETVVAQEGHPYLQQPSQ